MKFPILLLIAVTFTITSCSSAPAEKQPTTGPETTTETPVASEGPVAEENEVGPEEGNSDATPEKSETHVPATDKKTASSSEEDEETVTGTFHSLKGVMKPLSCYCYNCGYITTADGEKVEICFEDDDLSVDCKEITVTGGYIEKTIEGSDGPCPGGERTYLQVDKFTCE